MLFDLKIDFIKNSISDGVMSGMGLDYHKYHDHSKIIVVSVCARHQALMIQSLKHSNEIQQSLKRPCNHIEMSGNTQFTERR